METSLFHSSPASQILAPNTLGKQAKRFLKPHASQQLGNSKGGLRTSKSGTIDGSNLTRLLNMRQTLQERVANVVTCTAPILIQNGEGIIWPHTINMIQGQTGTHKSRVAELFTSFLIANGNLRGETLGLAFGNPAGPPYSVCYIDTERNQQEQFIQAVQQMKQRAGYEPGEHPTHFDYNSLLDIPRTERLAALREYLGYIRSAMSGHLMIVLDQLADCVADFNDPKESMLLTDLLNVMVNQQDVTFLCIIHENPGGSKARGHLGTESANKASTVLQVGFIKAANDKPSHVLQMKYIKRRSGSPNLTFHVQYDAEKGELVPVGAELVKVALDNRKRTAPLPKVIALLGPLLVNPMPVTKLKDLLLEKLGGNEKTIGDRLTNIITNETSVPDADGIVCILKKEKNEKNRKESLFRLVPVG